MGIFDIFKGYKKSERVLLTLYTQIKKESLGFNDSEARKMAQEMLDCAISSSKEAGTYDLPSNFGDIIVNNTKTNDPFITKLAEEIRIKMSILKMDGVTDEDIRFWWNLSDVERFLVKEDDNRSKMLNFIINIKNSSEPSKELAAEKAAKKVKKLFPVYEDTSDQVEPQDDNRPLPIELKNRINNYIEKRLRIDSEKYREELFISTSCNAFFRKEIKAGRI